MGSHRGVASTSNLGRRSARTKPARCNATAHARVGIQPPWPATALFASAHDPGHRRRAPRRRDCAPYACRERRPDDRLAARPDLQPADARVRAGHERHELVRRLLPELRADVVAPQRSRAAATSTRPRSSLVNGSRCRPARADAAWRGRMPGQSLGAVFALERPIAGHERTARGREPWRGADGRGQPAVSDRQAVPSRVPACATRTHGRP